MEFNVLNDDNQIYVSDIEEEKLNIITNDDNINKEINKGDLKSHKNKSKENLKIMNNNNEIQNIEYTPTKEKQNEKNITFKKKHQRKKHFKEFLLRNKLFFEKKRERIERQKILFEKGKKIKSEQEIIEGFNRLIDDANRRFEARERRDQLIKDVKNSTNNDNNKKYNNNQWNVIYNRFISYEKKSKEKIIKDMNVVVVIII